MILFNIRIVDIQYNLDLRKWLDITYLYWQQKLLEISPLELIAYWRYRVCCLFQQTQRQRSLPSTCPDRLRGSVADRFQERIEDRARKSKKRVKDIFVGTLIVLMFSSVSSGFYLLDYSTTIYISQNRFQKNLFVVDL